MAIDDQPAIGLDGQLLDASKLEWYHDPDDAHPIHSIGKKAHDDQEVSVSGRRIRPVRFNTGTRLKEAIAEEKLDEYGNPTQLRAYHRRPTQPRHPCTSNGKRKRTDEVADDVRDTDLDDNDFDPNSSSDTGSELAADEDLNSGVAEISNKEV